MKFIYLDEAGNQVGPVDESAVIQEIRAGRLTAESAIRNSLLREFRTVAEFSCFEEVLAQAAPQAPVSEEEVAANLSPWAYLRQLAANNVREEESNTISAKLHAADAKVIRRILAMLMDAALLFPVVAVIFIPSVVSLKHVGTQDTAEIARQRKAKEVRLFTSSADLYKTDQTKLTVDAQAALEEASQQEKEKNKHSVNRAVINKMLPGALRKLDNAYLKHNERIEKASDDSPRGGTKQKKQKKSTSRKAQSPAPVNQELAEYEASKSAKKSKPASSPKTVAAYKSISEKDRPLVLVRNLPGGEIISMLLPTMMMQWEDRFYADGLSSSTHTTDLNDFALRNLLITGSAPLEDGILLRAGGDVRRLTDAEATAHFATPLKLSALVILLYYTLAFSIFAQTVGMWFWGTFLTRSQLAEVLPLRALLYTMTMLIFGIFMIPAVLITKRSVADWICKVRQVGVASVSKSS